MAAGERRISKPRRVLYTAILVPILGASDVRSATTEPESDVGAVAAMAVGWMQPKLVQLQPGLLIGDKPPQGWSHLVVKSIPRLASGEKDSLPNGSAKTAAYFRTVILANVKPVDVDEREFELTQVGIGVCVPRKGEEKDVVVAADRLEALGLHLSWVEKKVLDSIESEMAEGKIIARTPTFALVRSPATVVVAGNEHRKVNLNYAFCVEKATGKLDVGLWTSAFESDHTRPPNKMVRLNPEPIFDCPMDVRAKKVLGVTVPLTWSFAMSKLPEGRVLQVPHELGELIASTARRPKDSDPEELEHALDQTLASISAPDKNPRESDKNLRRTAIPPPHRVAQ
jgi:hypothetical protein